MELKSFFAVSLRDSLWRIRHGSSTRERFCCSEGHTSNSASTPSNGDQSNGDRRTIIAGVLCLCFALQAIIAKVKQSQQASLFAMYNIMLLIHGGIDNWRNGRVHPRSIWRLEWDSPFADRTLLASYSEKDFRRRYRVMPATFYYICSLVAPDMQRSKRGGGIPLEKRVALCLNRLGTGNYLLACADLFGMSEGLACVVVRQFCSSVMKHIRPLVIPKWTPDSLKKVASQFEGKHGLPFIMGAIDGSHIPIIAPSGDSTHFFNRKGFYSVLLQGVVDIETTFWDWDFGWAGSLHDYTLFTHSLMGRKTLRGDYKPYKLISDAAYPTRMCMYVPFKGTKEQLEPYKAHWNFIQSSTRMCVERAFGVLKGRWRILLRCIEMNVENISDVVGACICLHNLCVMQKDFADPELVEEAKKWLQEQQIGSFGDLKQVGTMRIYDYPSVEVDRLEVDLDEFVRRAGCEDDQEAEVVELVNSDNTVQGLKDGTTMHVFLAKKLFERHLAEQVELPVGFFEEESNSACDN